MSIMISIADDRFDIDQGIFYLDEMFGERKGYVSIVYGHNPRTTKPRFAEDDWQPKYYKWPSQRDDLIEDVDNALNHPDVIDENIEIFICPALRKTPERTRGSHAPLFWVWADMDHKPTEDQIDRINHLGGMTVLSGSDGHRHVYLPLDKPVTAVLHKALCLALKDALGAKDSKIAENDLLRLPGSLNWKRPEPKRVFLKSRARRPRPASHWKRILCLMTNKSWDTYADEARATTPKDLGAINPTKRPKLKGASLKAFRYNPTNDGQRHDAIYKLVRTMKEDGYTRDQTHATLHEYPPAVSKWGSEWRISNDVDRIWQKYKIDRPDDKPVPAHLAEEDDGLEQPELQFHVWGKVVERVRNAPPPRYLFQGIWVEGDYGVVSAQDKAGKSWAMGDAAISCASQTSWMDTWACEVGGPVIICFGEGSERKQVRRLEAIARSKGLTDEQFLDLQIHAMFSVPQIGDDQHMLELETKIQQVKPALVIVDPFYLAAAGADASSLSGMGALLQRIQLACQRHGAALMVSHHWNKTGNGDAHSRTSGVGLTAWGRVLISIEVVSEGIDADTKRSTVKQQWHIKGDEISSQVFVTTRDVWEDTPGDLTSRMNYQLSDQGEAAVPANTHGPKVKVTTVERIMDTLKDNRGGLSFRGLMDVSKDRGTPVTQPSLRKYLPLLEQHGYIRIEKTEGRGNQHLHTFIKPFKRSDLENDAFPLITTPINNRYGKAASPRQLDMSNARPRKFDRPRRRTRMNV